MEKNRLDPLERVVEQMKIDIADGNTLVRQSLRNYSKGSQDIDEIIYHELDSQNNIVRVFKVKDQMSRFPPYDRYVSYS